MKGQILKILKKDQGIVSGEALSTELGISRVSIWKHIQKLQKFGYDILATPKGYQLLSCPDIPFPWEFSDRKSKIFYYPEVTSTMDVAKDLARKGCPDFTVVIAGYQKKGRGRLNRVWLSEEGGLYFTIVLRPQIPVVLSSKISFLASLTLTQTLRAMFNIEAMVKWPNDILVDGHKISGILSELEAEAEQVNFINIGLGINVNNDPSLAEPAATSLKKILGQDISKKELLARYLDEFENRIKKTDFDQIISEWKKYTVTLKRYVRVVTANEVTEGEALDVDETGALILKVADGSLKKILYGDCFH